MLSHAIRTVLNREAVKGDGVTGLCGRCSQPGDRRVHLAPDCPEQAR